MNPGEKTITGNSVLVSFWILVCALEDLNFHTIRNRVVKLAVHGFILEGINNSKGHAANGIRGINRGAQEHERAHHGHQQCHACHLLSSKSLL